MIGHYTINIPVFEWFSEFDRDALMGGGEGEGFLKRMDFP